MKHPELRKTENIRPDTTELMKDAVLFTINAILKKIEMASTSPEEASLWVQHIEILVKAYTELNT